MSAVGQSGRKQVGRSGRFNVLCQLAICTQITVGLGFKGFIQILGFMVYGCAGG